jgi:uncharacterized phiE125 gp8 family phage protein
VGLTLVTAPTVEPITWEEALDHLKQPSTDDRELVQSQIRACREHIEGYTGRQICTATYDYSIDKFSVGALYIPRPPLQSITSVKYIDTDGDEQTVDSSVYDYEAAIGMRGELFLAYDQTWPTARAQRGAVTIRFVAGYGLASSVPDSIKQAIKMHLGLLYGIGREAATVPVGGNLVKVPFGWEALLAPYKVVTIL